jgi:hypothetical protein
MQEESMLNTVVSTGWQGWRRCKKIHLVQHNEEDLARGPLQLPQPEGKQGIETGTGYIYAD